MDKNLYELMVYNAVDNSRDMFDHWYWSDFYYHAACVLAVLYVARPMENGTSVRDWLCAVAESGPREGLPEMSMTSYIEDIVARFRAMPDDEAQEFNARVLNKLR